MESMEQKHTPAPWHFVVRRHPIEGVQLSYDISSDREIYIATGQSQEHCNGMSADMVLANARLIAAAPDLLDALVYAMPYLEAMVPNPRNGINADCSVDVNAIDRARAAIAKATTGE